MLRPLLPSGFTASRSHVADTLAARRDLFSLAAFPLRHQGSTLHLLSEDPDHGFALYADAARSASRTPPHDHTTWAVVVAVDGQELNKVYQRLDDRSDPERCRIRLAEEVMVEPGRGMCLMPEDIHSIHTAGDRPTRHLHMYGLALERLNDRKAYDMESGQVIPYNRSFMKPTATAAG